MYYSAIILRFMRNSFVYVYGIKRASPRNPERKNTRRQKTRVFTKKHIVCANIFKVISVTRIYPSAKAVLTEK